MVAGPSRRGETLGHSSLLEMFYAPRYAVLALVAIIRGCVWALEQPEKNNYHAHAPIRCADAGISSTADGEVVLSSNDWFQ